MFPYARLKILVLIPLVIGLIIAVLTMMVYGYQGKVWTQETIFFVSDGHCTPPEGIGAHCFGDFALPYALAGDQNTFAQGNLAMAVNSVALLLYEMFSLVEFHLALFIYLLISILALCAPFLRRPPHVSWSDQITWLALGGLLTLGSLATIDRGNNISFVVPALFLYLLALHARRWLWVVAAITIISTIKFWGIYFVVGLLAHRKYRHAAWSLTLSATTNLIGIVVMHLRGFDYSLYTKIRNSVEVVLDRDYSDFVSPFAISFSGLSKRVACIFVQDGPCDMPSVSASMVGSSPVKIFLLLTCLFTVILLIRNQNVPAYVWMTAISGLGVVAVPDAPAYNAAVIIAALGAIISTSSPGSSSESGDIGSWQLITAIPIVASLTPAVLVHHEPWATSTVSGDELWWRSYYFTIPLSWFLFYASSILFALHLKRSGDEGPPPPQHTSRSRSQ